MITIGLGNNAARGEAIIEQLDDFLAEMYTNADVEKLCSGYGTDMITDEHRAAIKGRHLLRLSSTNLETV